ncbi:hypothetical protein ACF3DV_21785 [Chlorogloeopsis fritschii PCC 9212]|uniref:Uncharacterized protein n=1 Tax=Chlorogloeopsis fritschii PCC 6912 TaxID=211165 RepID=A0A433N115_CHLFR|nr:hypothetical protein [Chlorogloeopsis fritschii]MBF2008879.1 hypothetical protein [Chlorogloeopsis fritschii C42_A2020_084]RUR74656.1 hypothetical protein PCC6912_51730 [Chlorogloeopsis fritschii PCC 6912]
MKYDASQIRLINIPQLEQLEDGKCCRTYIYRFTNSLPEQKVIDQIANSLEKKFTFSKEAYEIPEDVEICASILIERLQDNEAKVRVLTTQPEEVCVYIFGIHTLPRQLEERFGTVQLIQGEPRETWISGS